MKNLILCLSIWIILSGNSRADEASWYSEASTLAEGYTLITASGEVLDDSKLTCASWDYDFGCRLLVTCIDSGRSVLVTVTDRGPNKELYKKGRTIDLTKKAFMSLAPLEQGIVQVSIKKYEN